MLLFWDDGERQERRRVERVVALVQQFAVRFTTVDQVRRQAVDQLSRELLVTGLRVKLGLAAAWSGQHELADRVTRELTAGLPAAALERLHELQSHRP